MTTKFAITDPTKNLKILVWGEYKVGKTTFAMQMPKAVIMDLERGSLQYQKTMGVPAFYPETGDFEGLYHACRDAVKQGFETIIIDQISTLYQWHQKRWHDLFLENEKRSRGNKGEYYNLQPSDYGHVKGGWRIYLQSILTLPVNVVCIARSKPKYKEGGAIMQKEGDTYDTEKGAAYEFDYIMHIQEDRGKRVCHLKQRCIDNDRRIPDHFPLDDARGHFYKLLGIGGEKKASDK